MKNHPTVGALALLAVMLGSAAFAAETPPPGYAGDTWVDSHGCAYFRAASGAWTSAGMGQGGASCASVAMGVSPLTGFPVPPGYRVAWQDGRLNPLRGPVGQ